MKNFIAISGGGLFALICAASLMTPAPAQAWEHINKVYRCTEQARTTVCYDGKITMRKTLDQHYDERCHSWWIEAKALQVRGNGLIFAPPVNADSTHYMIPGWDCLTVDSTSAGYHGFISPCTPGGLDGITQIETVSVSWYDGWGPGPGGIESYTDSANYPLATSTCNGGPSPHE